VPEVVPLAMMRPGEEGVVVTVQGGFGMVRRLAELGLVPGARVRVESSAWGPVVVWVSGFRIAIGRGLARRVLVRVERGG